MTMHTPSASYPPPPRKTANPAPQRPANSLRRTSSIDVAWPEGVDGERLFVGRARDFLTGADGQGRTLAEGEFTLRMSEDKTITRIAADPAPAEIGRLVGARAGGHLRMLLREVVPELIARADPLYLVLDDLSGTALVSAFAWGQWFPERMEVLRKRLSGGNEDGSVLAQRANVCWGLQDGNSGVTGGAALENVADADAGHLRNPADPAGWHAFLDHDGPGFRRARRIDVTYGADRGTIHIDSAFQDSARLREGGRVAIHEYSLGATVDAGTLEVIALEPKAHILPFRECPGAVHNVTRLVGRNLGQVREDVLEMLRGPEGCTHLNDALRALADVPRLVEQLRQPA
ncbi:DUF2889 family protein [Novosphingobium sp. PhB57]|uniref:DUF2889 domain-containing protein n=1 Tax=Novosphingobium sp. PhB57 TaxID=2485107 RepID=UPI0010EACC55|nr:DUF2889 domain-containing protein [Novosphingobium sp. PhB57]TCU55732.1 DUF2889 family protein [Novosphingobium sp. PhB57]